MPIGKPVNHDPEKKPNRAVISIGSNIDPEPNIRRAMGEMAKFLRLLAVSDFVTTRPVGNADQPDFRNGAVLAETGMEKAALEEKLRAIETELGRRRTGDRFAPRTMDLDVVWWNGLVCHPDAETRDFVKTAMNQALDRFGLK
ncbi:MAG: 2-amino-4-hydroxy-6-hydroxymethyldihydropteridine diphosphokinase [bacterium]|nr:2-amino-4-hydroxy-6-hydroxymethyldihydropteridine diphosphokinase [bacterium]